jgi:hypothetical protein
MGMLENAKYGRKALVFTNELSRKNDDDLNNLLFDIRTKYKMQDDDYLRMNICLTLIAQRQILERLGKHNDLMMGGSNVGSV